MYETHDEFLSGHPVPDEHTMERHPRVHPHDILNDLYHAPMHGPRRTPTQHRITRRIRRRHDGSTTKPPQMHADIRSSVGGARSSRATNDWPTERTPVLEGNSEVLRGVERKVPDLHAEVVDDEARLATDAARQPRSDKAPRRAVLLERLGEQAPHELVRVAVTRERHRRAAPGAQGSPGRPPLEQQIEPRCRCRRRSAWGPVDEPVGRELDAVLEREGGSDERVELLANLIKSRRKEECVCETPVAMAERERARLRIAGGRGGRGGRGSRRAGRADLVCE